MSVRRRVGAAAHAAAPVFAALGDETRLTLVQMLCEESPQSIAQLTSRSKVTRQAITKHLHALESVGLVQGVRQGRQNLFEFTPKPIEGLQEYLGLISVQWDHALAQLKQFVED